MIDGWLYDRLTATDLSAYPIIGAMSAWQVTFVGVGLPGLLVVLLMLFMLEPQRRGAAQVSAGQAIPVREDVRYLSNHWQAYSAMMMGVSMFAIIGCGHYYWSWTQALSQGAGRNDAVPTLGMRQQLAAPITTVRRSPSAASKLLNTGLANITWKGCQQPCALLANRRELKSPVRAC